MLIIQRKIVLSIWNVMRKIIGILDSWKQGLLFGKYVMSQRKY